MEKQRVQGKIRHRGSRIHKGYRLWDMGTAGNAKKASRIKGPSRPST